MDNAKVAVIAVVVLVVLASLGLALINFSGPDVKVGVAWREGSPETLVDTCTAIEEAGGTCVMLGQVFCDGLEYDDRGRLVAGLEENGMLGPEAAQTVKSGTWRASNAAGVVGELRAVVFTGGEDISPNLYADPQPWVDTGEDVPSNPERDVSDYLTMSYCLDMDIPVLAICRGMQMLSVVSGAAMIQDIPGYFEDQGVTYAYEHRNPMPQSGYRDFAKHSVDVFERTILHSVYGKALLERCPSWHHQAVASVDGTLLTVSAMSYAGGVPIIEGVERADKTFAVGVQYHPETAVSRGSGGQDSGYMDYDDAIAVFKTIVQLASLPLRPI